jgi:drug/metabolite transporter (DMT)-like permease
MAIASARGLVAALTIFFLSGGLKGTFRIRELCLAHYLAGLSLAFLSFFFIAAMKYAAAANAIVLQYSAPVWVAFLAPFLLKERTGARDWVFILVICGGMVLFFVGGLSTKGFWGNIFAIASGFFFASQALCLRFLKNGSPASAMILGNALTFLVGLGFWGPPWPDWESVAYILALGVAQLGFSYYLYSLASPHVSSLELVMVTIIEPILSPLWVFWILGERPGPFALAGGMVVLSGVILWGFGKAHPKLGALKIAKG